MKTALDASQVERVRHWLEVGQAGMAWLTGFTGSGMTSMVNDLTRDMQCVRLTSSDTISRQLLKHVCSNSHSVNGKRKALILEECEVLLNNEAVMADLSHIVKHNKCIPIVCISKASRVALQCEFSKKASLVVNFQKPSFEAMVGAVTEVALAESLPVEVIKSLCHKAHGDVRHVVQTLRTGASTMRDFSMQSAEAIATILGSVLTTREALNLYLADAGGVPSGLWETFGQTTKDIDKCLAFLDMVSLGDVVDERIHSKQAWDLMELHGCLTVASAAVTLPKHPGVHLSKYGTVWNKRYMQCTKLKALKSISDRCARHGGMRLGAADLGYVRSMFAGALAHSVEAGAQVCADVGLDAQGALHLMRLWNTGYKLSTHAKLKKCLEVCPSANKETCKV